MAQLAACRTSARETLVCFTGGAMSFIQCGSLGETILPNYLARRGPKPVSFPSSEKIQESSGMVSRVKISAKATPEGIGLC